MYPGVLIVGVIGIAAVAVNYMRRRNRKLFEQFLFPANTDEMGLVIDWLNKRLLDFGFKDISTELVMLIRMILAGHAINNSYTNEDEIKTAIPAVMKELFSSFTLFEGVKTESVKDLCAFLTKKRFSISGQKVGRAAFVRGYFYTFAPDHLKPVCLIDFLVKCIGQLEANLDDEYYEKIVKACDRYE